MTLDQRTLVVKGNGTKQESFNAIYVGGRRGEETYRRKTNAGERKVLLGRCGFWGVCS